MVTLVRLNTLSGRPPGPNGAGAKDIMTGARVDSRGHRIPSGMVPDDWTAIQIHLLSFFLDVLGFFKEHPIMRITCATRILWYPCVFAFVCTGWDHN